MNYLLPASSRKVSSFPSSTLSPSSNTHSNQSKQNSWNKLSELKAQQEEAEGAQLIWILTEVIPKHLGKKRFYLKMINSNS